MKSGCYFSLLETLANSTPATPIETEGAAIEVEAQPIRRQGRQQYLRRDKRKLYALLFGQRVRSQGYLTKIHSNRFIVYRQGSASSSDWYQCDATHESIVRAYAALRLLCGDSYERFLAFSRENEISETTVPILLLTS